MKPTLWDWFLTQPEWVVLPQRTSGGGGGPRVPQSQGDPSSASEAWFSPGSRGLGTWFALFLFSCEMIPAGLNVEGNVTSAGRFFELSGR